jgi:hypothetical protein
MISTFLKSRKSVVVIVVVVASRTQLYCGHSSVKIAIVVPHVNIENKVR